jgi:hypothetical protein
MGVPPGSHARVPDDLGSFLEVPMTSWSMRIGMCATWA